MANISKVKLPNNATTYLLADENGRKMIAVNYTVGTAYDAGDYVIYNDNLYKITANISAASNTQWSAVSTEGTSVGVELKSIKAAMSTGIHYRGTTTTPLTDGGTTNPIQINGSDYTAVAGDLVIYDGYEFLFDGTYWEKFGTDGTLKAMAFADTASGSATVNSTGTAAAQTFTGTAATINVTGSTSGVAVSMVPGSGNKTSITPFSSGGSFSQGADTFSAGSLPSFSATMGSGNDAETLTFAFSAGSLPTFSQGSDSFTPASGGSTVDVLTTLPIPVVTQGTVSASGSYTPAGTNGTSAVTVSGTATITVSPDNAS